MPRTALALLMTILFVGMLSVQREQVQPPADGGVRTMDPHVTGALVGATIAGAVALIGGWLGRRHEVQRAETDWFREKLLEAYSNCIYYLVKLSLSASEKPTGEKEKADNRKDVRQHFSESQRYLILLRAYHSVPSTVAQLKAANKGLADNWNDFDKLGEVAEREVELIKELLEHDPRVKSPS